MRLPVLLLFSVTLAALAVAVGCAAARGTATAPGGSPGANATWEKVTGPAGSRQLRMVSIGSNGTIFVAERSLGFFRSSNNGATWTPINLGIVGTSGWTINVAPGGLLVASTFVATTGNVVYYRSTDNGDHWTAIPGSYNFSKAGAYSGAAFAQNGNLIFGGFWSPGGQSAVSYSTDGGISSAIASTNPMATAVMGTNYNPVGHDLWMGTEADGLFRSTDNGATWSQTFDPAGSMGNNRSFAFNQAGQVLVATITGVWRSSDSSGTKWAKVLGGDGRVLFADSQFNIYYGKNIDSDPASVYRSTDGGSTWQRFDTGMPSGLDIESFAQNPVDGKIYAAQDGPDLYRTLN